MEASYRFVSGLAAALAALFAPIGPLVGCTLLFIAIDFVTGVAADRAERRRAGEPWYFESRRAWRTIVKGALAATSVAMMWLIEHLLWGDAGLLPPTRLFAGFICSVELWSFLENAARISPSPLFDGLRRYVRCRIRKEASDA